MSHSHDPQLSPLRPLPSADNDRPLSHSGGAGHPPDEYTRLLPNRLDSTHYLSPDDPAVSPYNLFTVRLVRVVTVALACLTFLWWTLLLVALFITPPGLHARGSPFFAFGYATVAFLTLATELLFFSVPSRSTRVLSWVAAGLLVVDAVVILAVGGVRHEEMVVGAASVLWAAGMAVWAVAADRTVTVRFWSFSCGSGGVLLADIVVTVGKEAGGRAADGPAGDEEDAARVDRGHAGGFGLGGARRGGAAHDVYVGAARV